MLWYLDQNSKTFLSNNNLPTNLDLLWIILSHTKKNMELGIWKPEKYYYYFFQILMFNTWKKHLGGNIWNMINRCCSILWRHFQGLALILQEIRDFAASLSRSMSFWYSLELCIKFKYESLTWLFYLSK